MIRTNWKAGEAGHVTEHNRIGSRLKNGVLDVRDFGAVGDWHHDDTDAFQAAIDAAAAQQNFSTEVFVPPSVNMNGYLITRPIQLKKYLTLRGVGMGSRIYGADPAQDIFVGRGIYNTRIMDLNIVYGAEQTTGYAVKWVDSIDSWMIRIFGGPYYIGGIPTANGSGSIRVLHCVTDNQFMRIEKASNLTITDSLFYHAPAGHSGLEIVNLYDSSFVGVQSRQHDRHCFELIASCRNTFMGCRATNASWNAAGEYDCINIDRDSHNNRWFGGRAASHVYYNTSLYEPHARYGVNIAEGAEDNRFYGLIVDEAITDRINDAGTGTAFL